MPAPILPAGDPAAIARAAEVLSRGGLVAIPTETVYGLAADASDGGAIARLYAAKGRPRFNPLIAHVPDLAAAEREGVFTGVDEALAAAFWPGPLTLVVRRREDAAVALLASAGLDTIALRAPAHAAAQALLAALGRPFVAPSANRSGRLSPTTAAHVAEDLGDRIDLILDGGPCALGLESTIVTTGPDGVAALRPGAIPREAIARVAPIREAPSAAATVPIAPPTTPLVAPGMLVSHYAPRAALRLNAAAPGPGEAFLGFGPGAPEGAMNLSRTGDLVEAAARLFGCLRALDATGAARIAVAPIPNDGLGEAINDRLARAAAPRPADAGER